MSTREILFKPKLRHVVVLPVRVEEESEAEKGKVESHTPKCSFPLLSVSQGGMKRKRLHIQPPLLNPSCFNLHGHFAGFPTEDILFPAYHKEGTKNPGIHWRNILIALPISCLNDYRPEACQSL